MRSPRAPRPALAVALATVLVALAVVATTATTSAAPTAPALPRQDEPATTLAPTTTLRRGADDPGRVAYVTPTGDVVVAEGDGSSPVTIGTDAAANAAGLAPLSWRQPASDAVAYVREDGALVVAPIDGSTPTVLATDAVVPSAADENILSWDLSGSFLTYLAAAGPDRVESRVVDLTTAEPGTPPQIRTIGNPDRRTVLAQAFSPLDPIIYQKTADSDTGREFTVAIVEPFQGTIFGSRLSLDDVTFTPDGRYVFAVSRGSGNVQQLVRVSMRNPTRTELVTDRDRVCRPSVSPDARLIVFAAGPRCEQVWTIRSDGTDPKRIVEQVGDTATFDTGEFTWSLDGSTITHAACRRSDGETNCGGGYWDIPTDGGEPVQRADAGSVRRESRALLRPVKVQVDITGPVEYSGRMQAGVGSVGDLVAQVPDELVEVKGVDELDNARSFEIKAVHPPSSIWMSGTIRIVDSGFDETFQFFGRVLPFSLGYAKLRGIWMRTGQMPMEAGQLVVTIER